MVGRIMSSASPHVPLSILDLSPRSSGMSPADALAQSRLLAQTADRLGYKRFWMAEHHGTETFMSSATSLLLGHIAEHTESIRLGSGGVMLPNHAPLMVAEYYGTLATLYGDRFDLGLGRAPGTDPMTAAALARGNGDLDTFSADVTELSQLLGPQRAGRRVRALPGEGTQVPLWMLGSSTGGAQVAAALGLPFAFASHFAPDQLDQAIGLYRSRFNPEAPTAQVSRPHVMAGINVLAAPTSDEARFLFTTTQLMAVRIRTGQAGPLDEPVKDLSAVLPEQLLSLTQGQESVRAVGTPEEVKAHLEGFTADHDVDELVVTTYAHDPAMSRRSHEMLADVWLARA